MDNIVLLKKFEEESGSTLETIAELNNKFNYFEIIKKEESEIVHSNVLAWLFNPKSNHNLQAAFLTQFASKIGIRLTTKQIKNTHVEREYPLVRKSLDILITDYSTYFIAIENKIKASLGKDQLSNYYNPLEEKFKFIPEANRHYLFLTPKSVKPKNSSWEKIDYKFINNLIANIKEEQNLNMSNQIKNFLEQYITVLGRDVLKIKDKVKELCMELYMKHDKALDLIFEHRMERYKIINKKIRKIINGYDNLHSDNSESTQIKFTSTKLDNTFENKCIKDKEKAYPPFYFEFQIDHNHNEKMELHLKSYLKDLDKIYHSNLKNKIRERANLFDKTENINDEGHDTLWRMVFLSKSEYRNLIMDNVDIRIEEMMKSFCEGKLHDFEEFFENFFKTK